MCIWISFSKTKSEILCIGIMGYKSYFYNFKCPSRWNIENKYRSIRVEKKEIKNNVG